MSRRPRYPWSTEPTVPGELYAVERGVPYDAYKVQRAAYAHARAHRYAARTRIVEVGEPGQVPTSFRVLVAFAAYDDPDPVWPEALAMDEVAIEHRQRARVWLCPSCGAETTIGFCRTPGCEHEREWICASCNAPRQVATTPVELARVVLEALTAEERAEVLG